MCRSACSGGYAPCRAASGGARRFGSRFSTLCIMFFGGPIMQASWFSFLSSKFGGAAAGGLPFPHSECPQVSSVTRPDADGYACSSAGLQAMRSMASRVLRSVARLHRRCTQCTAASSLCARRMAVTWTVTCWTCTDHCSALVHTRRLDQLFADNEPARISSARAFRHTPSVLPRTQLPAPHVTRPALWLPDFIGTADAYM